MGSSKSGNLDCFAEFSAAVTRQLPRTMTVAEMQHFVDNQGLLASTLRSTLRRSVHLSKIVKVKGFKIHRDNRSIEAKLRDKVGDGKIFERVDARINSKNFPKLPSSTPEECFVVQFRANYGFVEIKKADEVLEALGLRHALTTELIDFHLTSPFSPLTRKLDIFLMADGDPWQGMPTCLSEGHFTRLELLTPDTELSGNILAFPIS